MTPPTSTRFLGSWWRANGHIEVTPREDVFSATLPSAMVGADFQATFTVRWTTGDPSNAWNHVRGWLQHNARIIAARWTVTQLDSARNDMHYWLSRTRRLRDVDAQVLGCSIELTASAEAIDAASRADDLKRQLLVAEHEQELELARLRYMRDKIFSEPSMARAYWLSQHPDAFEALLDDRFERVAGAFGHSGIGRVHAIAEVLDEFLRGLDGGEREYLLTQLAQVFASFGRADLNEKLATPRDGEP